MSDYKKILVAIDIYAKEDIVLKKALKMADSPANISLVYVTFPAVYLQPYSASFSANYVDDIHRQAEQRLTEIAQTYDIPQPQVWVKVGSAADEIHSVAKDIKADLIIIGTHGQSGLKLLLGSTANSVIHGVKCDVLAIKV